MTLYASLFCVSLPLSLSPFLILFLPPSFCIIHYEKRVTCVSASFIFIVKPLICLSGWLFTPLNLHPFIHQCHSLSRSLDSCVWEGERVHLSSGHLNDCMRLTSAVTLVSHWQLLNGIITQSATKDKMHIYSREWEREKQRVIISRWTSWLNWSLSINDISSTLWKPMKRNKVYTFTHIHSVSEWVSEWVCEYQVAIYFALAVVDDA